MLEPILQQVGQGNPQLAQLIGQHPEQFLQLLGEDGDDDAPLPPGAQAISVTEEEREAIERVSVPDPIPLFEPGVLTLYSSAFSVSKEIKPSRPTSHVTRTRNSLLTSSSTNLTMTMPLSKGLSRSASIPSLPVLYLSDLLCAGLRST
jgi:hypothetical protein